VVVLLVLLISRSMAVMLRPKRAADATTVRVELRILHVKLEAEFMK